MTMRFENNRDFSVLKGKTLTKIERLDDDELIFHTTEGSVYRMYHEQDCCESVYIDDICGNLDTLLNEPLITAEERTNHDSPKSPYGSHTWTFYELATIKGAVTIRWYGQSNGYYSESVDFVMVE